MPLKLVPDFGVLSFCGESRENFGEDSWFYGFCESSGLLAVFDGCGGSGSKVRECFRKHTDAYAASRGAAVAVERWMQQNTPFSGNAAAVVKDSMKDDIQQVLTVLQTAIPENRDVGFYTLPTTMAGLLIEVESEEELMVTSIHAGDSRNYLLTPEGLQQLSADDSDQPDPFDDLYDEGIIQNMINCDREYELHSRSWRIRKPCILLSATDGCFGYVSTPMEFEGMILHTLLESSCAAQWEENLYLLIKSFAGDDHTMCLATFGYSSFAHLQDVFRNRYAMLHEQYLDPVWAAPEEDRATRRALWQNYRKGYMYYLEKEEM